MSRPLVLALGLFVAALTVSATRAADPPRLPRDNLLLYRGEDGKTHEVKSVEDWAKRRVEIFRGTERVMG